MTTRRKTWLITGFSSGFGRALAEQVLARGDAVVLTARDPGKLSDLAARYPETAVTQKLDVTAKGDANAAVALAEHHFGGLDVLVNNAGYGMIEVEPLGHNVIIVEPGAFRTDFLSRSIKMAAHRLAVYDGTAGMVCDARDSNNGTQPGDPVRGAEVILAAVDAENPPLRLALGADAYRNNRGKIARTTADHDAWEKVATATWFEELS